MVPSWSTQIGSWWSSYPPRLLETRQIHIQIKPVPGIRNATPEDIQQLPEFWARWFSTPSCRCVVPLKHIQKMVSLGKWEILVYAPQGLVVGSIVRRWIKGLHVASAFWPKAGMIDYFAIHPAWRKRGIGRALLATLHNITPAPIPPHLMLWEGIRPTIPPLSVGCYWSKRCVQRPCELAGAEAWKQLVGSVWSEYEANETQIFKTSSGTLAVWNTFHRSIPDGLTIGIIMAYSSKEAVEEFANRCPYGILLSDTQFAGWTFDSPFQWIAYNLNPGFTDLSFPCVAF